MVTEVPILAPMIMGMALLTFRTPPPTKPTTIAVVDEEDWIKEVARIPINKPATGLEVVAIRASANPLPNIFKASPIN